MVCFEIIVDQGSLLLFITEPVTVMEMMKVEMVQNIAGMYWKIFVGKT